MIQEDIPIISADESAMFQEGQGLLEEQSSDLLEMQAESSEAINATVDILADVQQIQEAEQSGMLNDTMIQVFGVRVNRFMDILEDKLIITKEERVQSGLQFDKSSPVAGLQSFKETLKEVGRKLIEWIIKIMDWLNNAHVKIFHFISNFIKAQAGISKKTREKIKTILEAEKIYLDTDVINEVIRKNIVLLSYALAGNLISDKIEIDNNSTDVAKLKLSFSIANLKLDTLKFLSIYEDTLADLSINKLPRVEMVKDENGADGKGMMIVADGNKDTGYEKYLRNLIWSKVMDSANPRMFLGIWLPGSMMSDEYAGKYLDDNFAKVLKTGTAYENTRIFVTSKKVYIDPSQKGILGKLKYDKQFMAVIFSKAGLSIAALSTAPLDCYNLSKEANPKLSLPEGIKPELFASHLTHFVDVIDKGSAALKSMASESSKRINDANKFLKDNVKALELNSKAEESDFFNPEFRNRLKMLGQQLLLYPSITNAQIHSLSDFISDGVKVLNSCMGTTADQDSVSDTNESSNEKPILLIAAPTK